jgi:hypothetical protein
VQHILFDIVGIDMQLNNTEFIVAFLLQQWLLDVALCVSTLPVLYIVAFLLEQWLLDVALCVSTLPVLCIVAFLLQQLLLDVALCISTLPVLLCPRCWCLQPSTSCSG